MSQHSWLNSPFSLIRTIPNYPRQGVSFKDITPLIGNPEAFREVTGILANRYNGSVDKVAAIEARGFVFGAALAVAIGVGFVPVRKPGKLPATTALQEYTSEYGSGLIEVHVDAIRHGERVVVIDDILATGGTAVAAAKLLEGIGATVIECAFVVEIVGLGGRKKITDAGRSVYALHSPMED